MHSSDFGRLRIVGYDDPILFQHLTERAAINRKRPGHAWSRVVLDLTENGVSRRTIRKYHLNLHNLTVVITECWDGVETARKTFDLDVN